MFIARVRICILGTGEMYLLAPLVASRCEHRSERKESGRKEREEGGAVVLVGNS